MVEGLWSGCRGSEGSTGRETRQRRSWQRGQQGTDVTEAERGDRLDRQRWWLLRWWVRWRPKSIAGIFRGSVGRSGSVEHLPWDLSVARSHGDLLITKVYVLPGAPKGSETLWHMGSFWGHIYPQDNIQKQIPHLPKFSHGFRCSCVYGHFICNFLTFYRFLKLLRTFTILLHCISWF